MSTNSRIGLRLADGSILSVYHHWDGYPQWVGVTLNQQYPTREDIAELIDGGNMSCCYTQSGWEIEDEEKLKVLPYKPLYYTERGESMEENAPRLHKTTSHFFEDTNKCCGEYAYIKELDGTLECWGISYWNEETKDFNDVFTPIKQEIPADYPQELMA